MIRKTYILPLMLLIGFSLCFILQGEANPVDDHGDTYKVATDIFLNSSETGQIDSAEDVDYFRLDITEPGELRVYTTGSLDTIGSIEDDVGVFANGDQEGEGNNFSIVYNAKPETYYIRVRGNQHATGPYTLHTSFTEAPVASDAETSIDTPEIGDDHGDTYKVATDIFLNSSETGQIDSAEDVDYFRLDITEPGELTVYTTGVLDTNGSIEDDVGVFAEGDQEGEGNNFSIVCAAKPETYYIRVRGNQDATGPYTLHTSFVPDPAEAPVASNAETSVDTPEITDDHGDLYKVATELFFDIPQTGQIDRVGDIDYFLLEIPEPGELTVYTTGVLDTIGSIEDDTGVAFIEGDQEGEGNNFSIVCAAKPETYYIRVRGYGDVTGDYTLHASFVPGEQQFSGELEGIVADPENNTPATATNILLGSLRDGAISPAGDIDYWRVQVPHTAWLYMATVGSTDTTGRLEDSSGRTLATDDDSGVFSNFRISHRVTAGTYYIRVAGFRASTTGNYQLLVVDDLVGNTPATATSLALNSSLRRTLNYWEFTTVGGTTEAYGDIDYFRVRVTTAGELTVETTGSTDTVGRLEDDSGNILATNDDGGTNTNFKIVRNVTAGTYYIRVIGAYNSRTKRHSIGHYTIAANLGADAPANPGDHGNTPATATPLIFDSPLGGRIDPAGDIDYFRVRVTTAGELTVETMGNFDTIGRLEDDSGSTLATNDDGGLGRNFRIVRDVSPGTYYVRVTGWSSTRTGDYRIEARMAGAPANPGDHGDTPSTATPLIFDSPLGGRIDPAGDIDYFRVRVTTAGELTVETTGSTDTVGRLEDDSGSTLVTNDDGGAGTNFKIVRDVSPGTYYVRVTGFGTRTGDYRIEARMVNAPANPGDHGDTPSTATPLIFNSPLGGRIDPASDIDYFRVRVTTAGELTVETTGSFDTVGRLEDDSGSTLATNDDGGAGSNFRIVRDMSPGTYYIRVTGWSSTRTGDYRIEARMAGAPANPGDHGDTPSTATPLIFDSPLGGRIDPAGDIDYFRVRVTTAGELTVETTGSTDTVGRLEDDSGSTLVTNDDGGAGTNFKIVHDVTAGTYYIRVASWRSRRIGDYTLQAGMDSTDVNVDVNGDGVVSIEDLIIAVTHYGLRNVTFQQGDVNGDNVVNRADFLAILDVLDAGSETAAAPSVHPTGQILTAERLQRWIAQVKQLNNTDANFQKGLAVLEELLAKLIEAATIPTATAVLPNYPNPFNPETWIPYQLAKAVDVTVTIYDIHGHVVRSLDVGHQRAGLYHSRSRAMHWDGRNAQGESVASGVYFYTLTAGEFSATHKLLIAK